MLQLPPTSRLVAVAVLSSQVGALLGLVFVGGTLFAPLGVALLFALVGPVSLVGKLHWDERRTAVEPLDASSA
jgi:hypothetical protein